MSQGDLLNMSRMYRKSSRARRGFTLLELMLVMAILVILASLGTMAVLNMQRSASKKAETTQIAMFQQACIAYKMDMQSFPATLQDLLVMPAGATPAKWSGPYLQNMQQIPMDTWGNQYSYQPNDANNVVQIMSAGPDRQVGTADDITNIR